MIRILLKIRRPVVVGIHLLLIVVASYLAFWLRFDGRIPGTELSLWLHMLPWLLLIRGVTFIPFRLYEGLWRYTGIWDLRSIVAGVSCSTVGFYLLVRWGFGITRYPRSVFIIDAILLVCFMGGIRLARRLYRELSHIDREKRVLIYGAGDAGEMIVRDMKNNGTYAYEPVGFVDDDPSKVGRRIHGVPVLGTRNDLPRIMAIAKPDEVLVAVPSADPRVVRMIVKGLEPFTVPITTLPSLRDVLDGKVAVQQIRQLSVEDLLARPPVGLDPEPVRRMLTGKRVMVTGAGGSIGSELCRQIAGFQPNLLILYERYENGLYEISTELSDRHAPLIIRSVVGDVADSARVNAVMSEYWPDIIFHAAAHKHVPLMELNPSEAVKNNVTGTRTIAEAAARHGLERFILISSDKAVNPSSIMGATKRVAELTLQDLSSRSRTRFVSVRFGNVLGSSGSVVPRFLDQIKAGGPVTVTHPEVYRYFMLIPEAVQLVLHAATQPETGVIYALEMGEPISVLEIARTLIRLSGYVPGEEIPIEFVGLRPGEKLFEELVGGDETAEPSGVAKVMRIRPGHPVDGAGLREKISRLEQTASQSDPRRIVDLLYEIVPTLLLRHSKRRSRPPQYRTIIVRKMLPRLAQCDTIEDLRAIMEELRNDLGFKTLRIHFKAEVAPSVSGGVSELEVFDPTPPTDPDLVLPNGVPGWVGVAEIASPVPPPASGFMPYEPALRQVPARADREALGVRREADGERQVVGEVRVTKPAWRRRRASENDDQLLQVLAEGLGSWINHRMQGSDGGMRTDEHRPQDH